VEETKTKSQKLVLVAKDNTVNQDLANVLERVSVAGHKSQSDEVILLEGVAPVDLKRLYESMGEEPEELFEILGIYLDQMTHNLKRLDLALESEDAHEIDLIAHNCCGVSANCGMTAVVAPLRELERMGRENCLEGSKVLGAQVSSEFEIIKVFLDENLAHLAV
jgi:HPt (histidine-containing phosphotransfer) domain-containing protein